MATITYINLNNLKGKKLDKDFEKFCKDNGIKEGTEFSVSKIKSVTGHDAYLVVL